MGNNIKQFEKVSFWQLVVSRSVVVPIIQRDYAHGRENKHKVRDRFLNVLYKALTKEQETVELDFVYGSEENAILQPLDGQQRLTTLFLLHWYIAKKEGYCDADRILSKFTYETRTTSREFCKKLIKGDIVLEKEKAISQTIKEDTVWFISSWTNDPTVSAMLTMLDAIHLKFKETTGLWEKLVNKDNCPISFLYVKLENFGLSDDLYIKMNARGKQLTDFENFKSHFEKYIEDCKFELDIDDEECKKGEKLPEKRFAHKIDTSWTDLFWTYRNAKNGIDDKMIEFIAGIAINCYAERKEIAEDKEDIERVKKQLVENGKTKNYSNESIKQERIEQRIQLLANNSTEISPNDFPTKESFQQLVYCFNKYADKNISGTEYAKVKPACSLWDYCEEERSLFEEAIRYNAPEWKKRTLFYAQTCYLLTNPTFVEAEYNDWMRVCRNIIHNSTIDSASTFMAAVALIRELSEGANAIYTYLTTNHQVTSRHAADQVKEEREKAKLISQTPTAKKVIHDTEDTNFCEGKIEFALHCIDYDNTNISTFSEVRLERVRGVFSEHFNEQDLSNDCRRALFTIGDTKFYNYWESWLYVVSAEKRCLIKSTDDLKTNFSQKNNFGNYLKELIKQLSEDTLDGIIEKYIKTESYQTLPGWKQKIISTKGLLEYSRAHHIAIARDESCCWLIPGKKVANNNEGKRKLKRIK